MILTTQRLCGTRQEAGLYLEIAEAPNGLPVERFLLCPPVRVDLEALGISPVGMHLIQGSDGTQHIGDYIGSQYANVLDLIEEGQLLNFSRRIPSTFPFELLSPQSRYLPIHPRGWINNFKAYFKAEPSGMPDEFACAQRKRTGHEFNRAETEMCMRLWRQDLSEGWAISNQETAGKPPEYVARLGERQLPCNGSYVGLRRPDGIEPSYAPAIIASLPVGRIVGVKSKDGRHRAKMERARKGSPFPVMEVEF